MKTTLFARGAMACGVLGALAACGGGGSDTNEPAPAASPPVITAQPTSQSVQTDGSATFAVTASGSGLGYQWRLNGAPIAGAAAATYTTPPAGHADHGGSYTVTVTNADGSVTSNAATLRLALSANQQVFESLILAPSAGSHVLRWNLNLSGAQTSGANYVFEDHAVLTQSPLTAGPQTLQQSAPVNLAATLALSDAGPVRILKDGAILVVPGTQSASRVGYVGGDVRVDALAADGSTVAYSQRRTDYSYTALSGLVSTSPAEFAQWHNSIFANPDLLIAGAAYGTGAGYVKHTAMGIGDRYNAFDCTGTTTGADINPCQTGVTLEAALTAGMVSNSDGTTYRLADGELRTVGGVPVWVATATLPVSATLSSTVQYRIYFHMNGNVYTGALIKDGAVIGGSYYVSNPAGATVAERLTFLPYFIRMNKAAADSIAAAMAI